MFYNFIGEKLDIYGNVFYYFTIPKAVVDETTAFFYFLKLLLTANNKILKKGEKVNEFRRDYF